MTSVISCSYAFMLPVATAPNALVYDASTMKSIHMLTIGFFMNVICVAITNVFINYAGPTILDFEIDKVPEWVTGAENCTIA